MFASVKDPLYLISFIVYFFFGYLLYAAILVGLGSVCNSLKEAQNLLQPVFILLIVPLVSMMFVVQEPNGIVAKVLSYVPLFTPFLMMNRAGGPPELYEYAITSVLLLASVWFAFKAAGKVFRVGVLMTGNPPKLKEIFGWLRQS
jgi:ABC-type Na+ efflux pump permease subunit